MPATPTPVNAQPKTKNAEIPNHCGSLSYLEMKCGVAGEPDEIPDVL